jgi:8-oxo-dGTP pyrophosphatase MutT (NUDIX family)
MEFTPEAIQALLTGRPSQTVAEWSARPAAVLLPFFKHEGRWRLLFTERTHDVADHKGQVAFPGGRADATDTSRVDTALREAEEEIGLRRADVTVLGTLDELLTVTQYRVTPVVGQFPWPYEFNVNPHEIAALFHAPLDWLADPGNLEIQWREPPFGGPSIPVFYFRYEGHTIWGVTARILVTFLEVAGWRSPDAGRDGV